MTIPNTPEPELGEVTASPEAGTRAGMAAAVAGRHPGTVHLMRYFAYAHLADKIRKASEPFGHLAVTLVSLLPDGPELTVALRKLVEAKDCAVRALVDTLSAD